MLNELPQDHRKSARVNTLTGEITGLLNRSLEESRQPFLLSNVSETGLGLWTGQMLNPSDEVELILGQQFGGMKVECKVIWCRRKENGYGFDCGLTIESSTHDLQHFTSI